MYRGMWVIACLCICVCNVQGFVSVFVCVCVCVDEGGEIWWKLIRHSDSMTLRVIMVTSVKELSNRCPVRLQLREGK